MTAKMAPNVRPNLRLEPRTSFRKLEIFFMRLHSEPVVRQRIKNGLRRPSAKGRAIPASIGAARTRRPARAVTVPYFPIAALLSFLRPQHKGDGGLRSLAAAEESRAIERRRRIFLPRLRRKQGINGLKPTKMMDIERKASYLLEANRHETRSPAPSIRQRSSHAHEKRQIWAEGHGPPGRPAAG